MSAYKMLFVAEAASFRPKGGSSESVEKKKGFQALSAKFVHMCRD